MDDFSSPANPPNATVAIDRSVLDHLFDLGDKDLRNALSKQLDSDFRRLYAAIGDGNGANVAKAAHELKGLAATVGAARLADMARSLDAVAAAMTPEGRAAMVAPIHTEIDLVLSRLHEVAGEAAQV